MDTVGTVPQRGIMSWEGQKICTELKINFVSERKEKTYFLNFFWLLT